MRRWKLYLLLLASVIVFGLSPFAGTDVGKLLPVEAVRLSWRNGQVRLETDMGDIGVGATVEQALADLKNTTGGILFLDTADYLLVKPGGEWLLEEICDFLRPACGICLEQGEGKLGDAAAFLAVHKPLMTLGKWRGGFSELPQLQMEDGRMRLVQ